MGRPVMRSLEYFPTKTKLLYDTRIKAMRRHFKDTGDANNAFVVFDYLFREIFGNEGYYIKYTKTLVGDTADFCYVPESFVIDVIRKCIELELFDKTQFEQNEILTSRAIQNKYQDIFTAMKRKVKMESRFCVHDGLVYSEETPVYSEGTPVYLEETPEIQEESTLKKEKKERKESGVVFVSENSALQSKNRNAYPSLIPAVAENFEPVVCEKFEELIRTRARHGKIIYDIQQENLIVKIKDFTVDEQLQILQYNIEGGHWSTFPIPDAVCKSRLERNLAEELAEREAERKAKDPALHAKIAKLVMNLPEEEPP